MAMSVAAFAIVTMIAVYYGGMRLMKQSRDHILAVEAARNFLEAAKDLPFSDLPATAGQWNGRLSEPPTSRGFPPPPYPSLESKSRIFFLNVSCAPAGNKMRLVTVRVTWDGTEQVELSTFLRP